MANDPETHHQPSSMMPTDEELATFRPGVYLHSKGALYEASNFAHNANIANEIVIHYIGLQMDPAHEGPRHAVREWFDWHARVHRDGTVCDTCYLDCHNEHADHESAPRFRYLGPSLRKEMLAFDPWERGK